MPKLRAHILLAEDGEDNQRLIAYHLRKAGATVVVVENGVEALDALDAAETSGAAFDLLLTDMQMPTMDGYTLARTLRQNGSSIPIIAVTAHTMAEDRQRCLDAGCNDYASKPIDRFALLETCRKWTRDDDVLVFPLEQIAAQVENTAAISRAPDNDSNILLSTLTDDADLGELVAEFLDHLVNVVDKLQTLRDAGAWSDTNGLIHQLKGAAGGYGFMPITAAARNLEAELESDDSGERDKHFDKLLHLCRAALRGRAAETSATATAFTTQSAVSLP